MLRKWSSLGATRKCSWPDMSAKACRVRSERSDALSSGRTLGSLAIAMASNHRRNWSSSASRRLWSSSALRYLFSAKRSRESKRLELVVAENDVAVLARLDPGDFARKLQREIRHAARVALRGGVSLLDRVDACRHELVKQVLDVLEEGLVVDGDSRLAGDGLEHLQVLRPEADHLIRNVGYCQLGLKAALRVDQLDGADHLFVVVTQRNREHRFRAVAVLRIEPLSALRLAGRGIVSVVVEQARVRRDRVADHRLLVHRYLEVLVRVIDRRVLACREAQLRLAVVADLNEPKAGAVGVGQLAHRREDEILQLVDIPLGRQLLTDPIELLELAVLATRLLLVLPRLLLERHVLHRQVQEMAQGGRGGVGGTRYRNVSEPLGGALPHTEQDQRRRDDGRRVFQPGPFEADFGQHRFQSGVVEAAEQVDVEDGRVGHAMSISRCRSEFWR